MKKWIQNLKEKLNDRIERAYGFDELGIEIIAIGLFFVLLDMFSELAYISYFGVVFLLLGCFRCYSSDIEARRKELQIYEKFKAICAEWFTEQFAKIKDRITYKYVKCPHCGAVMKLPRGAGKVTITCPICNNKFNKYL